MSLKTTDNQDSLQIFRFIRVYMTDPKFLINLGAKIRELRLNKEMTQIELATRCNFGKASMSRIESGETNITVLTLNRISKALEVDITEFFSDPYKCLALVSP